MAIRIVRLGTPRARGEGTRIGTVRHPPRGVPKEEHAAQNWYDIWLPDLAPSRDLLKTAQTAKTPHDWLLFVKRYRSEMAAPEKQRLLELLAVLSRTADLSVGCYCEDEAHCHRAVLRELLLQRGAQVKGA